MKRLKEIIREEMINEKVFGSQAQYDAYRKKHNLKPGTKVKVAGKTITVRGKGKLSKKAKSTADRMADKLNKKMDALNKKRTQGKVNEVDYEKVVLPAQVKRWMGKFVDSMKDAQLNRLRRSAILYKVIQASGMSPKTLMADIQRIKRGLQKETKIKEGKDTIFDVAKKVMKDKQHQNYKSKKGMVKLDMQTANLLTQVFKKINPKMKKILSDLGEKNPAQLVATLQAVVK